MKNRLLSLLIALLVTLCCLASLAGCDTTTPLADDPSDAPSPSTPTGHQHTDANSDELCDGCGESVVVVVDFYVINDLHGKFCDTDAQPGVDELASYLRQAYTTDDHVVLVSSGDMWQGSAESNLTGGAIITEWMNELDFVCMTLGNHEFDWGEQAIRDNLKIAEFPFLAINIYDLTTGKRADYCEPSVMIERGGIQIGIIGAIGDCYSSIAGDKTENVQFKVGSELTALVKAESDRLRDLGADVIVYSIHDGYGSSSNGVQHTFSSKLNSYYDSALSDGYVDVVFESHSHQSYTLVDSEGVYHIQGGGENRGISHVEIKVNTVTDTNTVTDAGVVKTSAYEHLADDEATEALEDKYAETIEYAYGVLGRVDRDVSGGELADLVASYYLDIAQERWGEQYNIVLGGGYINTRSPYDLTRGEKRYADVLSLLPFDNRLVLCSISGDKLLSQFINTSNGNYHIALSEYGMSILDSISPTGTYYIMTDSYSSTYAPNGLTEIAEYDSGVYARDLVARAIQNGDFTVSHKDYTTTPIATALEIGWGIPENHVTNAYYYLRGTVKNEPNATYGNLDLSDGNGKSIYIYGLYDTAGNRYDAMSQKLSVGDEVVVYGQITHYVSSSGTAKIEIVNAELIEHVKVTAPPATPDEPDEPEIPDVPDEPDVPDLPIAPDLPVVPDASDEYDLTSISDALAVGRALGKGEMTEKVHFIQGTIKSIVNTTYGNMYIKDDAGNEIYIYGIVDSIGTRFDAMGIHLETGDKIVVSAPILNYYDAKKDACVIELKNARLHRIDKMPEQDKSTSISELLVKGESLPAGLMTKETYLVTGKVASEPHATYGNFYLEDDQGNSIYVYGLYDEAGNRYDAMSQKLTVGQTVMVSGPLMHYVNPTTGESKIELYEAIFMGCVTVLPS